MAISTRRKTVIVTSPGYDARVYAATATAQAAIATNAVADAVLYAQTRLDTVAALKADTVLTYALGAGNVVVGDYIQTRKEGFSYEVAASGATDHHIATAGGVKLYVQVGADGFFPFEAWGPAADTTDLVTGTDNTALLQSALDAGKKVSIGATPTGFTYGITQVVLNRNQYIRGPGQYVLALRGTTTSAAITGGGISDLKREVTITDLYVENNRGGDAVDLEYCPDFNFVRVYFRSVSNGTLGTTAARGLNAKNCERGHFVGQCRFGGNPAFRMVSDCNAVRGDNVVASGGSLGLAVDISGCQNVKIPFTIETSLEGIRLGDNTFANLTEGGWCSGIDLSGSYLESVGTPIKAGHGFAVNGLNLDDCWMNNAALSGGSPFPVAASVLDFGRLKNVSLRGGRWIGAGTEVAMSLRVGVAPSGAAPGILETSDIDLTTFESVASLINTSAMTSLSYKATVAATNKVKVDDFGNGYGSPFEWVSPTLTANVTYGTMVLSKVLGMGGRITKVEIVEGSGGSLSGMRLRVGNTTVIGEVLDKTFGAVSPLYEDEAVTNGLIRAGTDIRFRLDAGAGAGTFRVKIRGFIDNS